MDENVKKALKELDAAHNQRFAPWRSQWQTIRAHLAGLEVSLADYKNANEHAADDCLAKDAEIARLQSRLAAADALLREALPHVQVNAMDRLAARITARLSENGQ